jgi:hypothetical protein
MSWDDQEFYGNLGVSINGVVSPNGRFIRDIPIFPLKLMIWGYPYFRMHSCMLNIKDIFIEKHKLL